MNAIIGLIIILLLGYLGSQATLFQDRFSVGIQSLFFSGIEFLFVGLALGPHGANLLSDESLRQLIPILSLGLGWIGLVIGMQFDAKVIVRVPRHAWRISWTVSAVVFVVVMSGVALGVKGLQVLLPEEAVYWLAEWPEREAVSFLGPGKQALGLGIVLGGVAILSSHTVVALLKRSVDVRGEAVKLLQWLSDLGAPLAIGVLGLGYGLFHITHMNAPGNGAEGLIWVPVMPGILWMMLTMLLGVALGWMLHYLTSRRLSENQLLLLASGTVIFSSGLSACLHLSPLLVNLIMGATLVNLPNFMHGRIHTLLLSTEKPFFVVFLILLGALWPPITGAGLVVVTLYLVTRTVALFLGAWVGVGWHYPAADQIPKCLGLAMLPEGGVTLAVAVDYYLIHPGSMADLILSVIILSVVVNQVAGPMLMLWVLRSRTQEKGEAV
ncbi:MAG: hypothetical protein RBU29_13605 [bacterium]|jgi:hypothetical protein|nr:hypothetical protein [bacterium]